MTTASGMAPSLQSSPVTGTLLRVARIQRGLQSPVSLTMYLLLAGGGTACWLLSTRVENTCSTSLCQLKPRQEVHTKAKLG